MAAAGLVQTEGAGALVVLGDVAFDHGLQVDDAREGPALQAAARGGGEEALDNVDP